MNWRRFFSPGRLLAETLALVAVLVAVHLWQTRGLPEGPAPRLQGGLLDGEWFDLDRETGCPMLVHFWATWCPVCRLETDTIDRLARHYRVVTVAIHEEAGEVRAYMENEGVRFPVLADPHGRLRSAWNVRGVPTSFILDADGRIRFRTVGYTTGIGLQFRLWLADPFRMGSEDSMEAACP